MPYQLADKVLIELREGGAPPQYHHLRAHSARDVSELERDVAGADEHDVARHCLELEKLCACR